MFSLLFITAVSGSALFDQYSAQFGKKYASVAEQTKARECFLINQGKIDTLNAMDKLAHHGWNDFTDLCEEDFKTYHNLQVTEEYLASRNPIEVVGTPLDSVDWRTKGAVTPVKDQGRCGSCWAFSSTGNMEGQHFVKKGELVSLSEEELVQCSGSAGNMGCNGGLMDNAFKWVTKNGGIDSESDYPYTSGNGANGQCDQSKLSKNVASFSSHIDVASNEDQMATWVSTNGPLSVAVDAAQGWQTYRGGIMSTCRGTQLDHGVLVVGYGTEGSTDYWIVKNSWNTNWGEQGYIRLEKGTNQCGIKSMPSSAQV